MNSHRHEIAPAHGEELTHLLEGVQDAHLDLLLDGELVELGISGGCLGSILGSLGNYGVGVLSGGDRSLGGGGFGGGLLLGGLLSKEGEGILAISHFEADNACMGKTDRDEKMC